jgi:uncharacterized oligopeptide transporter (OPT) family protein
MNTETKNMIIKCVTILVVALIIVASAYYIAGMVVRETKPVDGAKIVIVRTTDRTQYSAHYVDVVVNNEGNELGYAVIACQFTANEAYGDLLQEQTVALKPGETKLLTFEKTIYGTWDYVVYVKNVQ